MVNRFPACFHARRSLIVMVIARASLESARQFRGFYPRRPAPPLWGACQTRVLRFALVTYTSGGSPRTSCSPIVGGPSRPEEVGLREYEAMLILSAEADEKVVGTAVDRITEGNRAFGGFGRSHRPVGPSPVRVRGRSPDRGVLRGGGVRFGAPDHRARRARPDPGRRGHAGQGDDPPPQEGREGRGAEEDRPAAHGRFSPRPQLPRWAPGCGRRGRHPEPASPETASPETAEEETSPAPA